MNLFTILRMMKEGLAHFIYMYFLSQRVTFLEFLCSSVRCSIYLKVNSRRKVLFCFAFQTVDSDSRDVFSKDELEKSFGRPECI